MTKIIYHIFLVIISLNMVTTKPCEIIEHMSCECHSSLNNETEQLNCVNHYTPMKRTIELKETVLQNPRVFDSFHLTFHAQDFNVSAMFLNHLSYLFPRQSSNGEGQIKKIKIILTFQDYLQLHFEDYSFYQLFSEKSTYTTSLSLELTARGKITFAPFAFNQLTVDQLSLHSSSLEPYAFEELFNNTNIGSLSVEGCTPRSNSTLRRYFNGNIRSAKFLKMVEIVSKDEFPRYPVNSMVIEAHEPRKINASTFINYNNLHGIHLIRPKFFFDKRSFDGFQYLPNLETLELDAETIKDHTFQHVMRTRFFTLGQNIRYLSEHSLDHLDYLTRLDLSKVVLDQLYPTAKCVLARYLEKQQKSNPNMIILPPQAEFCDCVYDFILNLLNKKPDNSYMDLCQNTQQERCQLSECDVVRNFRVSYKEETINHLIPSIDGSIVDSPISLYPVGPQTTTHRTTPHLPRQAYVYHHRPHPTPIHHVPSKQQPIHHQNAPVYDMSQHQQNQPTHENPQPPSTYDVSKQVPVRPNSENDNNNGDSNGSSFADSQASHSSASNPHKTIDPNAIPTDDYDEDTKTIQKVPKSKVLAKVNEENHQMERKNKNLKWISLSLLSVTVLALFVVGTAIAILTYRSRKRRHNAKFQTVPINGSSI